MSPIKSPREMLFEMAGVPSMSAGGKLGAEMYKLITQAIERYTKAYGKPPSPEDVKALREHVREISARPEIKSDPVTQAKARHAMATDPNMINPEGPDPFLVKQMTGRTTKGTYLKPKVQDINDPNVRQNIEIKQAAGELDDILPESSTPAADYMARMGTSVENTALASGKTPMIDKLKAAFFAKNKRYPTDEELEIIIAEFNPARHQYGSQGASIVAERPPTAKGMAEWKQRARVEGIPESFLEKPPADYPKYLMDELNLSRGVQPGAKPLSDRPINPDRSYADGRSVMATTPREMMAEMAVNPQTKPSFLKKLGSKALQGLNVAAVPLGAYETMEGSKELGRRLASKNYLGALNKGISTAGSAIGTIPYAGLIPSLGLWSLGEGLDYISSPEELEAPTKTAVEKIIERRDPRALPTRPKASYLDEWMLNKWLDQAGIE